MHCKRFTKGIDHLGRNLAGKGSGLQRSSKKQANLTRRSSTGQIGSRSNRSGSSGGQARLSS